MSRSQYPLPSAPVLIPVTHIFLLILVPFCPGLLCPCSGSPTSLSPVFLSQYSMFVSLCLDPMFPLCACPTAPASVPPCTCTGPIVLVPVFPTSWSQCSHVPALAPWICVPVSPCISPRPNDALRCPHIPHVPVPILHVPAIVPCIHVPVPHGMVPVSMSWP